MTMWLRNSSYLIAALVIIIGLSPGFACAQNTFASESNKTTEKLSQMSVPISVSSLVQFASQGDIPVVALLLEALKEQSQPFAETVNVAYDKEKDRASLPINLIEPVHYMTALHAAAGNKQFKMVQYLIDHGATINVQDRRGVTPLIMACSTGNLALVQELIKAGAQINTVPSTAPTALITAIQSGQSDVVKILLQAKANPELADAFGTSPLMASKLARQNAISTLLMSATRLKP